MDLLTVVCFFLSAFVSRTQRIVQVKPPFFQLPPVCPNRTAPPLMRIATFVTLQGTLGEEQTVSKLSAFAVQLAADKINNSSSILPSSKLDIQLFDTQNDSVTLLTTVRLLEEPLLSGQFAETFNLIGIIGHISSELSQVIASIATVFRMPQISYASVSPRLSDDSRFPFFFRTIPSDNDSMRAMALLCRKYGWLRVAYFASADAYGQDGLAAFTDLAGNLGVQIVQTQNVDSTATDPDVWRAAINGLKASNCNVIISKFPKTNGGEARARAYASLYGLFDGPTKVWLNFDPSRVVFAMAPRVFRYNSNGSRDQSIAPDIPQAYSYDALVRNLEGVLGVEPKVSPGTPTHDDLRRTLVDRVPALLGTHNYVDSWAYFAADAVYAFALAADQMIRDGYGCYLTGSNRNGTLLRSYLMRTVFEGTSGRVEFDANGDRFNHTIMATNVQPDPAAGQVPPTGVGATTGTAAPASELVEPAQRPPSWSSDAEVNVLRQGAVPPVLAISIAQASNASAASTLAPSHTKALRKLSQKRRKLLQDPVAASPSASQATPNSSQASVPVPYSGANLSDFLAPGVNASNLAVSLGPANSSLSTQPNLVPLPLLTAQVAMFVPQTGLYVYPDVPVYWADNTTTPPSLPPYDGRSPRPANTTQDNGLSSGAKAAIAVPVAVAGLAIIALIATVWWLRRQKSRGLELAWSIDPDEITLLEVLGQGAHGIVYSAIYRGAHVAVKEVWLHPEARKRRFSDRTGAGTTGARSDPHRSGPGSVGAGAGPGETPLSLPTFSSVGVGTGAGITATSTGLGVGLLSGPADSAASAFAQESTGLSGPGDQSTGDAGATNNDRPMELEQSAGGFLSPSFRRVGSGLKSRLKSFNLARVLRIRRLPVSPVMNGTAGSAAATTEEPAPSSQLQASMGVSSSALLAPELPPQGTAAAADLNALTQVVVQNPASEAEEQARSAQAASPVSLGTVPVSEPLALPLYGPGRDPLVSETLNRLNESYSNLTQVRVPSPQPLAVGLRAPGSPGPTSRMQASGSSSPLMERFFDACADTPRGSAADSMSTPTAATLREASAALGELPMRRGAVALEPMGSTLDSALASAREQAQVAELQRGRPGLPPSPPPSPGGPQSPASSSPRGTEVAASGDRSQSDAPQEKAVEVSGAPEGPKGMLREGGPPLVRRSRGSADSPLPPPYVIDCKRQDTLLRAYEPATSQSVDLQSSSSIGSQGPATPVGSQGPGTPAGRGRSASSRVSGILKKSSLSGPGRLPSQISVKKVSFQGSLNDEDVPGEGAGPSASRTSHPSGVVFTSAALSQGRRIVRGSPKVIRGTVKPPPYQGEDVYVPYHPSPPEPGSPTRSPNQPVPETQGGTVVSVSSPTGTPLATRGAASVPGLAASSTSSRSKGFSLPPTPTEEPAAASVESRSTAAFSSINFLPSPKGPTEAAGTKTAVAAAPVASARPLGLEAVPVTAISADVQHESALYQPAPMQLISVERLSAEHDPSTVPSALALAQSGAPFSPPTVAFPADLSTSFPSATPSMMSPLRPLTVPESGDASRQVKVQPSARAVPGTRSATSSPRAGWGEVSSLGASTAAATGASSSANRSPPRPASNATSKPPSPVEVLTSIYEEAMASQRRQSRETSREGSDARGGDRTTPSKVVNPPSTVREEAYGYPAGVTTSSLGIGSRDAVHVPVHPEGGPVVPVGGHPLPRTFTQRLSNFGSHVSRRLTHMLTFRPSNALEATTSGITGVSTAKNTVSRREMLKRELVRLIQLRHPRLVLFMGAAFLGEGKDERVWLVCEAMEGGSLQSLILNDALPLDLDVQIRMAREIAQAMVFLHLQRPPVVHRDLKPSNCLLDDKYSVKVADLGLSLTMEEATSVRNAQSAGTASASLPGSVTASPGVRSAASLGSKAFGFLSRTRRGSDSMRTGTGTTITPAMATSDRDALSSGTSAITHPSGLLSSTETPQSEVMSPSAQASAYMAGNSFGGHAGSVAGAGSRPPGIGTMGYPSGGSPLALGVGLRGSYLATVTEGHETASTPSVLSSEAAQDVTRLQSLSQSPSSNKASSALSLTVAPRERGNSLSRYGFLPMPPPRPSAEMTAPTPPNTSALPSPRGEIQSTPPPQQTRVEGMEDLAGLAQEKLSNHSSPVSTRGSWERGQDSASGTEGKDRRSRSSRTTGQSISVPTESDGVRLSLWATTHFAGTLPYIAPEVLCGEPSTPASDVYSFGILLYEILSRRPPYPAELTAEQLLQGVVRKNLRPLMAGEPLPPGVVATPALIELLTECWSRNPVRRPEFTEIVRRLDELQRSPQVQRLVERRRREGEKKERKLLLKMLPSRVAEQLKAGRRVEPEHFASCTIFFSDIVGYTSLASELSPQEVMGLLHRLYTEFDRITLKHNLFKIETIGDSYMVAGNLHCEQPDHAYRVAQFALDVRDAAARVPVHPDRPELGTIRVRCGFHTGPCVASVVGDLCPRYCLFGDSVNYASRMESNSVPLGIQMSPAAHAELYDELRTGKLHVPLPPNQGASTSTGTEGEGGLPDADVPSGPSALFQGGGSTARSRSMVSGRSGDARGSEAGGGAGGPAAQEKDASEQLLMQLRESESSSSADENGAPVAPPPQGPVAETLEQLGLSVTPRGKVMIKGKGVLLTYWLERAGERPRRQEDPPPPPKSATAATKPGGQHRRAGSFLGAGTGEGSGSPPVRSRGSDERDKEGSPRAGLPRASVPQQGEVYTPPHTLGILTRRDPTPSRFGPGGAYLGGGSPTAAEAAAGAAAALKASDEDMDGEYVAATITETFVVTGGSQ